MSEGFMVKSRWGFKLHHVGCPCGVCKSKRKGLATCLKQKAVAESEVDVSASTVMTPKSVDDGVTVNAVLASAELSTDFQACRRSGRSKAPFAESAASSAKKKDSPGGGIQPSAKANDVKQRASQLSKAALKVLKVAKCNWRMHFSTLATGPQATGACSISLHKENKLLPLLPYGVNISFHIHASYRNTVLAL